jgi:myo-inositol 2-dehydrogenase / D-chiro-inositol 1-dehydrogenase
MQNNTSDNVSALTRRDFLKNTSVLAASAAAVAAFPNLALGQQSRKINAGIIGFGGRGGGAARNFMDAAKVAGVEGKIVAVADLFPEKASRAVEAYGVPREKCFSGFDAYQKVLAERDVNYVVLATPPGFRPAYFKACVEAGKHIFTEKPVAVDAPGIRIMYAAGKVAEQKGLKVAAGTQRRHSAPYIETVRRIQAGEIGDIMALRAYWVNGGPIWHRGLVGDTEIERQVRNWYHYIWLCGDHIVEQHVHNIDVCNWVNGNQYPVKCWGMGARQQLGDQPGEIWDNFAVEFEYANGIRMHSYCGQIKRDKSSVSEAVQGTKGSANPSGMIRPNSGSPWRYRQEATDPFMQEHVDLINAIVKDEPLNEVETVTSSTLTALMGREAAYSGKEVEWETMLKSNFRYGPPELYDNPAAMKFGDFRVLRPPMPKEHDVFSDPAVVPIAKA